MAVSPIVDMSVPAADAGSPATPDLSVGSDAGGTPPSTGGCAVGGSDSLPTGVFVIATIVGGASRRVGGSTPVPAAPAAGLRAP